jgi:eukaryotic-like serine/threonine-protein kinase
VKDRKAGQVVFGRYQLVRPLARGGMSSVWVALDRKLKREVALKLMSPTYAASERSRQRFELEAMSVARLHSPYIVQVFDYGVDHDAPFIVMELLSGEDLRSRIKRERRLGVGVMARVLAQAAAGLSDAHDAGMVHRDMKPGNLFLTRTRSGEIVKILDFGVAKAGEAVDEAEITERGSMVGTPQYMSPEQIRCLPEVDARSDLFSLGVIVYRGLTGALPFKGKTTSDLAVNICSSDFVPPSQLVPDLPPGIDDFMNIALARAPSERFPNATAMAEAFSLLMPDGIMALSDSLDGPPSLAPPRSSRSGAPITAGGLGDALSASYSGTGPGIEITMSTQGGELSQSGAPTSQSFVSSPGATFSSAPPATLGGSYSGTLTSPSFDGIPSHPPQSFKRKVAIGALIVAALGVAGAVGTLFGNSAAESAASSAAPATPPPVGSNDSLPPPDENEATEAAPVAAADAEPTSEPSAAPAPKAGTKKSAPPAPKTKTATAPPPPAAAPKPAGKDDWDPFGSRK